MLIATDLDRTLLFSARATAGLGGALPADPVEVLEGRAVTYLARVVADRLRALSRLAVLVPATTRTRAQFARIALPVRPRWAVVASGAVVLRDGTPDPEWAAVAAEACSHAAPVAEARALLDDSVAAGMLLRAYTADDAFCYGIRAPGSADVGTLEAGCAALGWRVAPHGRKVYLLPRGLDKAHAVAFLAERLGGPVLAAGDTVLDREMLLAAQRAWIPAGSELAGTGFVAPHVRVTAAPGHRAAAEISAGWLAAATGASAAGEQAGCPA
jgi:hypothetical protein